MNSDKLPVGSFIRISRSELQAIIDSLKQQGYRTIGPQLSDGAVVYGDLDHIQDMPIGVIDQQDGGTYRVERDERDAYFDYVVGPQSLKGYLFPPQETVMECQRVDGAWQMHSPDHDGKPLAVIGPRSCDLHALRIQDRVFLESGYVDPAYQARREKLFIVAVNCRRAAATCFCHSMKTGPALSTNYDLGLFELDEHFVIEVGTENGGEVVAAAEWMPCSMDQIRRARALPETLAQQMRERGKQAPKSGRNRPALRHLDTTDIRDLLMTNLEHPRWEATAERCLSCANCTMVCPTCFCSSVEEVTDLTGEHVRP